MKRTFEIMTHIVAGYPTLDESEKIATTMIEAGVEYLEIQIPFTDPVADGPVITKANHEALAQGMKVADAFELTRRLREKTEIPLFFMTYYNIPFVYGIEKFCEKAKEVGITGLIVPDVPYDEEVESQYLGSCEKYGLDPILVVAPNTSEERLKEIGKHSKPLLYCVAQAGTTGGADAKEVDLEEYLGRVRKYTDQKIALGFGINSQEKMQRVGEVADVAVVGSQLIREYQSGGVEALKDFLTF